jgi:phosphoribosylaminoimidazolecarboxamide formyltransferase/IMP cyclohydrolase
VRIGAALISVWDKSGVVEFARTLNKTYSAQILSTGGTAAALDEARIPVTPVDRITGFPEMLDGRVKTLHPKVHGGILADRGNVAHMEQLAQTGIQPIDMVVGNLYPFEETIARLDCTFENAIENIDIGGPCMLRAAAKNHRHVWVVCDPDDYERILEVFQSDPVGASADELRLSLARKAFQHVSRYDNAIQEYLAEQSGSGDRVTLKYGENPHQKAYFEPMADSGDEARVGPAALVSGPSLSFNNLMDGEAARSLVSDLVRASGRLGRCATALIKHTNACGCCVADDPIDSYKKAYLGDPIAAAGAVLCMSYPVTAAIAEAVMNSFRRWGKDAGASFFKVDVWIAPSFDPDALEMIRTPSEKRKWGGQCRILAVGEFGGEPDPSVREIKRIAGGILGQARDLVALNEDEWRVATKKIPTDDQMKDIRLAWLICKHTKSNAVTVCRDGMLLGNGAGQMSRVKAAEIAVDLARENGHGDNLDGAVAATDAFFPVPDGPGKLFDAGISSVIQPGGSNRDADVVSVANVSNASMILTGTRHFKH